MTLSLTIGWWIIPVAITVAVIVWGLIPERHTMSTSYGFGIDVGGLFVFLLVLAALGWIWFLWAVLVICGLISS